MDERARLLAILDYGPVDRLPVWHTGEWDETATEWERQGLGRDEDRHRALDTVGFPWTVPTDTGRPEVGSASLGFDKDVGLRAYTMLYPPFEEIVVEQTGEYRVVRQGDGVIVKEWLHQTSLPQSIDYTFKGRSDWGNYLARLQPHSDRIPRDLPALAQQAGRLGLPLRIRTGSLIGSIRNWMGLEALSYLSVDDPGLVGEIVDAIADLACWEIDQVLPALHVDLGWFWEDICFRSGPLVSPKLFRDRVVPGYRRISDRLRAHGVRFLAVDSDGTCDALIPGWLEGGVNILYPLEVGPDHHDPMALRRTFGRALRLIGGIDKFEIRKGRAAIDAELERRLPLIHDGGYVPTPDHEIVPGTALDDYRYYLDRIRAMRT